MKLLLDTIIYIEWLDDPAQLSREARAAIANPRNFVFVSAATTLEITLKQARGKVRVTAPPGDMLATCRFHELPLKISHDAALRNLPPVHNDPFDRLLVAQALAEGMTLVSRNPVLSQYGIAVLAA